MLSSSRLLVFPFSLLLLFNLVARAQTLLAPQDLKVAVVYGNFIGLTWSDTATGEDSWWIQYRDKRNGAWTTLSVQPENVSWYGFRGAKPHTRYEFRVKACLQNQCSPYSNVAIHRTP